MGSWVASPSKFTILISAISKPPVDINQEAKLLPFLSALQLPIVLLLSVPLLEEFFTSIGASSTSLLQSSETTLKRNTSPIRNWSPPISV